MTRSVFKYSTLAFMLALASGCDSRTQPLKKAQESLEETLKAASDPVYAGLPDREYDLVRTQEALKYLAGRRSLEKPYTVRVLWCFVVQHMDDGRSEMGVQWMEGDTHVVGVVLSTVGNEGRKQWRLPVFEWLQILLARPEAAPYRETALRLGRIRILAGDMAEPGMRSVKGGGDCPPLEVLLPEWMVKSGFEVGVYDEKGNVSNVVPVFTEPGEPDPWILRTDKIHKGHAPIAEPSPAD